MYIPAIKLVLTVAGGHDDFPFISSRRNAFLSLPFRLPNLDGGCPITVSLPLTSLLVESTNARHSHYPRLVNLSDRPPLAQVMRKNSCNGNENLCQNNKRSATLHN